MRIFLLQLDDSNVRKAVGITTVRRDGMVTGVCFGTVIPIEGGFAAYDLEGGHLGNFPTDAEAANTCCVCAPRSVRRKIKRRPSKTT